MFRTTLSIVFIAGLLALSVSAAADEFTETLDAVAEAYAAGDINAAAEDLAYATQLLQKMKGDAFTRLLPEPMDGWELEVDSETNAAMGMFGGGVTARGDYRNQSGESFSITMMADNPGFMSLAGMYSNPQLMASMGEVIRIKRQSFVVSESGEISGVVGGRTMIQASGNAPRETIIAHLENLDLNAINAR